MPGRDARTKTAKLNCWEFRKCGREPGGANVDALGVCPAAVASSADCINGGKNGGRVCWIVSGTMCCGEIEGTFASKIGDCLLCDFYGKVMREEGEQFVSVARILSKLAVNG